MFLSLDSKLIEVNVFIRLNKCDLFGMNVNNKQKGMK